MTTTSDPQNDIVFLGINFNNFFKNCGCLQKRKEKLENESLSSGKNRTQPRKKIQEIPPAGQDAATAANNEETHSIASSTDWADLEEISFPADPTLGATLFDHVETENGHLMEDFTTQEPIDFEHLKQLTGVKQEEDDEKSNKSGLSKSSKRIAKEVHQQQPHASRFAPKDTAKDTAMKGKRKPWQPHEDAKVLELVGRYGQSWAVVASMMEGRTGKQIRDRYLNKLRPNIKRGEWTNEEDRLLLSLYYQIGHKWSKIATYLPGRTEGQVKNRFYSHIKKKILAGDGGSDGDSPDQNYNGAYQLAKVEGDYGHGNVDDYMKPLASPSGSTLTTASTQMTRLHQDKDVNTLLDKMVGYMDHKVESSSSQQQYYQGFEGAEIDMTKLSMNERLGMETEGQNPTVKLERYEELQKRRDKLEFLLAQTLKDMGTINPTNMTDV